MAYWQWVWKYTWTTFLKAEALVRQLEVRDQRTERVAERYRELYFQFLSETRKEGTMNAEKQLQYFKVIKKQSKLIKSFLYGRDEIFIKYIKYYTHVSMYHCALKCFLWIYRHPPHFLYASVCVFIKMNIKHIKYTLCRGNLYCLWVLCSAYWRRALIN